MAFWDTYAETDEERRKYALRFEIKDFLERIESANIDFPESINKLVHGKVKYKNLIGSNTATLEANRVKYPAFRKEYVFAYEKEYRFDIVLKKETSKLGYNFNIGKPSDIPFVIFVNPLLENKNYIKCIETIQKSKFEKNFKLSTLTKWLKPELWK